MENTNMIHRVNTVIDEISSLYHRASEKLGLSDSEMMVLYIICEYGETLSQSDIMNITGMSKQTINSSVSRMEKAGWLTRADRSGHRRDLKLTAPGKQIVRRTIVPFREQEETIFAGWTSAEREIYLRLNEKYRDALRSIVESLPGKNSPAEKKKGD